ncbi:hypothetical protein ALP05_04373 [Pseudomonas caricapapayae]|uniref:Archaeal S-adenosylmethionine synthetase n=1 Tax=Pseudomonas caricapapayae TaxID=46678 RepID=A0A3M6FEP1_9PSED|nr:TIGR03756 family integrating conjugative element protein [Pseudomonas caricapapayae]RMV79111.1 hypothetical protein ALP05_04373 [Pseudomonas caricapapayae]
MVLNTICRLRRSVILAALAVSTPVFALQSATIVQSAISPDCLEYRVVGICYWLLCTPFGCKVKTSAKVRHFIPEAVVSSYGVTGQNPWTEVAVYGLPNATAQDGGSGTTNIKHENEMSVFKNVDVIGHPATLLSAALSGTGYVCKSAAKPYVPYFLSTLDSVAWRNSIPEMAYPQALVPGQREVGNLLLGTTWGNVYPRDGFLHQVDEYKASAVMAQRGADVVTRVAQPHVYVPIKASPQDGYWPPGPVTEGDIKTHKWQELKPSLSSTCAVFPNMGADVQASDGAYAWALWRPYSCCKRAGQTFLGSIDFAGTGS